MKLTELDAEFIDHRIEPADKWHGRKMPDGSTQWGGFPVDVLHPQTELLGADGITFLCPKCFSEAGCVEGVHSIQVYFRSGDAPEHLGRNSSGNCVRWDASGTDISDLTLSPSIHVLSGCGWHGFVINGEAVNC